MPVGHDGEQEAEEEEGECRVQQPADRKARQEEGGVLDAIEERGVMHWRDSTVAVAVGLAVDLAVAAGASHAALQQPTARQLARCVARTRTAARCA